MANPELLNRVIVAHGGLARWEQVRGVKLRLSIGGNLLALKFKSPRSRRLECTVDTGRIHAVLNPFPRDGLVGIFEADQVRIETGEGEVVARRQIARDADGRVIRRCIWDDLDVLYFFGYALWNYTVTPYLFLRPGFTSREGETWREPDGSSRRTLHVTYPTGFPTHCREQKFYFDDEGLLRRLDYTAEVFTDLARGAHLCEEHRRFDGLVFPTHRVVYPRGGNGEPIRLLSVMEGWIEDVTFL